MREIDLYSEILSCIASTSYQAEWRSFPGQVSRSRRTSRFELNKQLTVDPPAHGAISEEIEKVYRASLPSPSLPFKHSLPLPSDPLRNYPCLAIQSPSRYGSDHFSKFNKYGMMFRCYDLVSQKVSPIPFSPKAVRLTFDVVSSWSRSYQ